MHVGMITPQYPPNVAGGGEISCQLLVDALRKKGVDVTVYVVDELFKKYSMLQKQKLLYSLLKKQRDCFDVFHCYNMTYLPVLGMLSKKYDTVTVGTLNGIQYSNSMLDPNMNHMVRRFRNRFIIQQYIKHISFFTTLCPMYKQLWMMDGLPAYDICVIPNMIDETFPAYHLNTSGFTVLFVGNNAWWRDIETVNKVAQLKDITVNVVGNGWKHLSKDIVQIKVPYFNMPEVYAHADVLVAPYMLPLPISRCILEGMMSELPVVATGNNKLSPVVKHNVNGLLCENNNDFMDHVCLLRDDKPLHARLAKRAKTSVYECCHPDVLVHDYIQVYEEVCA